MCYLHWSFIWYYRNETLCTSPSSSCRAWALLKTFNTNEVQRIPSIYLYGDENSTLEGLYFFTLNSLTITKMIQNISESVPKMFRKLIQNDYNMIQTWSQCDTKMITRWSQNDQKMIQTNIKYTLKS